MCVLVKTNGSSPSRTGGCHAFNTAMLFELAVIKPQAEEVLEQVPENCEEYAREAYRLRKFLKYFAPLPFRDSPPTSLLREFLGGSSFNIKHPIKRAGRMDTVKIIHLPLCNRCSFAL